MNSKFGRLDVLVYNSGAIYWASVAETSVKRFKLLQGVNPEGLYVTVKACLPWLMGAGMGDGDSAGGGGERQRARKNWLSLTPVLYTLFFIDSDPALILDLRSLDLSDYLFWKVFYFLSL